MQQPLILSCVRPVDSMIDSDSASPVAPQDVVTANPDSWTFDPFKLTREGDKLLGRGVTDCLGHVALLTELFRQLATTKPALKATVIGVYIANEENSTVRPSS